MKTFLLACLIVVCSLSCFSADKSAVSADRWMEIDLYWFNRNNIQGSAEEFWDRYYPLFERVDGWKGVVLNVGWVMDYVMEWKGDLDRQISLPKNMKQWGTFNEQGPLRGSTVEKIALWKKRFPKDRVFTTINYQPWTYGGLKKLAATLNQIFNASKGKVSSASVAPGEVADSISNDDSSSSGGSSSGIVTGVGIGRRITGP